LAKLSISIPDELKVQLDERADAENVPVSHVVTEALKAYFAQPTTPELPPGAGGEQLRQMQAYLWDLYLNYERTRSSALAVHYWAEGQEALVGIAPESTMKKPPWPKPRPTLK